MGGCGLFQARPKTPQTLRIQYFQRWSQKSVKNRVFFLKVRSVGFQGGPGRVPRGAFGALARNQEALGKVNQVQGGALFEGPGSAKVGQGSNFDVNPQLILTFSFFGLKDS